MGVIVTEGLPRKVYGKILNGKIEKMTGDKISEEQGRFRMK